MKKDIFYRDTLIVAPVVVFAAMWLLMVLGFDMSLTPDGADYLTTALFNLLFPLMVIGIGQMVYAAVLIADIAKMQGLDTGKRVLYSLGTWLAVQWLYVFVYLARAVWLLSRKKNADTV